MIYCVFLLEFLLKGATLDQEIPFLTVIYFKTKVHKTPMDNYSNNNPPYITWAFSKKFITMADANNVSKSLQSLKLKLNMSGDSEMPTKEEKAAQAAINVFNLITREKINDMKEQLDKLKESTKELTSSYNKTIEFERYLFN